MDEKCEEAYPLLVDPDDELWKSLLCDEGGMSLFEQFQESDSQLLSPSDLPSWCVQQTADDTDDTKDGAVPDTPIVPLQLFAAHAETPEKIDCKRDGTLKSYFRVRVSRGPLSPPLDLRSGNEYPMSVKRRKADLKRQLPMGKRRLLSSPDKKQTAKDVTEPTKSTSTVSTSSLDLQCYESSDTLLDGSEDDWSVPKRTVSFTIVSGRMMAGRLLVQ
tara:strand:- start:211 stop:861 length:651 start_codon:yes stop_codon:yes gene_type:complete